MFKLFSKSKSRQSAYRRPVSLYSKTGSSSASSEEWTWLQIDKKLAFITFTFVVFGLIFTYSSSAFDSISYFERQLVFDIVGVIIALFLSQTYSRIQQVIKPVWLLYATWVLLIIVLFTKPIANVHRWIPIGPFNLQPSEIAKVTLVIYLADYLSNVQGKLGRNWKLLLKPLFYSGVTFFLIYRAPDFGTMLLMAVVMLMMFWAAGANWKEIGGIIALGIPIILYQLIFTPYRLVRILNFFHPEGNEADAGYQVIRSSMAVGSGGWFGKGWGNSELKLQYLPEAHTDFIFAIMSEEMGLIQVSLVVVFFCWLLIRGISLACVAKNTFHSLVIFGLTLMIVGQAFFNMSMVIGIIPPKGIPLPFFSYGGSSMVMTLAMIGIICNLAAQSAAPRKARSDDFADYKPRNR